jgi:amino acid adenylation domain-containing protein
MNLIDILRSRAARQANKTAYTFLANGEEEEASLTFAELDRRARALGAFLQKHGGAGERVLLLYPPGLDFVTSFLGCLYGGAIAVPAYPPRSNRPDTRLAAIAEDARPRFALTTPALAGMASAFAKQVPDLQDVQWIATEELDVAAWADQWTPPDADPAQTAERVAFLQYTSGSTATPKGVMVTHRNLVHNERMIQLAFDQSEESVIVGWLPLYHDMGLIGNVLQPLYVGATCVLMAPVAFLQQPLRWLRAISRYKGTTSGGPNFAYELCVRKTDAASREGLDLSSWKVAFNGAEPVRAETLERFAATFAPYGFRAEAFYPCYGLAEATLFVTGGTPGQGAGVREVDAEALGRNVVEPAAADRPSRALVACGRPWLEQEVRIVDPESGAVLPEGQVGEIRVTGESVAAGYWNRPEASAEAFGDGADRELRTGDLGFFAGGELFVTGRVKDLIIVRGRNHYPQDIELTAERSHPALRPGGGAAFSVEVDGEEQLVIVHEVERSQRHDLDGVVEAVRRAVAQEHEVPVHAVALIKPGALPKTSSGKVRRRTCRADFLAGRFELLEAWTSGADTGAPAEAPRTPTEERLTEIWTEVFEGRGVGIQDNFFELGGDSLKATQMVSRINEAFGVDLPLDSLLSTPTLAALAELLDGLAGSLGAGVPEAPPLGRRPEGMAEAPLSFAQRRLWFLHQLDPDNPVHNIAAFLRLTGRLDVPALRAALDGIVQRHEALRTVFHSVGDEPVQHAAPAAPLALPVCDLSALPADLQEREEERIGAAVARRPFSLERGPFLHAVLTVRTPASAPRRGVPARSPGFQPGDGAPPEDMTPGDGAPPENMPPSPRVETRGYVPAPPAEAPQGTYGLVLSWHHIAADGWSLGVFVRELTALYRGGSLPALPLQYADFALWQRQWLRGEALEARLAYWRHRLAGAPVFELPTDKPRPAVLSHRGAHHEQAVPAALSDRLAAVARERAATPFMALLTGFAALLHRSTGQDDLVLGSPISGRNRRELEDLIGVFINNLVLRIDASGDPSFRQLLDRVRATALAAYAHQDLPFETLVDALGGGRDLSRTPIFQILFVEQNVPLRRLELPELTLDPHEIDLGTARFDLALAMAPLAEGWLGTWKYSTDLFDETTPARMAGQLENLLAAAAAEPDLPLSRLAWLSEAERHQVVLAWNDTATAYSNETLLHGWIEAQVERTPDAVAVSYEGNELTYRQLNERANRLARQIRRLGAGPESLVGVAAERSLELVVSLVATLKAGAAYVPLDPGYPRERLEFMLEDAGMAILLTQSHLDEVVPAGQAERVLLDRFDWEAGSGANLGVAVDPGNPAYAIYTSGSTGRPKGAMIPHRGIVNRLLWMQAAYNLGPADRVLQKTPFSFDVSVWEFFWPLITGARLVVAPPNAHQDAAWLARIIRDNGVTTLHFVPSMLQLFLEGKDLAEACRTVRQVMASGEALPYELQERFFEKIPHATLNNLYGPTEASVDVSFHACEPHSGKAVPIGRPIANIVLHVQDRYGAAVPTGVPGELLIGGVGLARGYLHRPALTADRFAPNPWGAPGERVYRTGDLARFRADGAIEFLGRIDHQIKIRGVRVELGEIEAALCRQPGVREAVVMARKETTGETRLVAYLVPVTETAPSAADLRTALRDSLPEAMVPSAFVVMPAFPLSPSGKVDRKQLPVPDFESTERERPFTAPRTPLEEHLAAMWRELLHVEQIGVHDSFFELGGDSIQGAMFINRLQEELGQIVYVMALFDAPNVADFAAYLERSYPEAAARLGGRASAAAEATGAAVPTPEALEALHDAVVRRLAREQEVPKASLAGLPKNPRALFILSPFRSGTTLFRVMLAGHPRLFAPPELELLAFRTMGERAAAYAGRNSFALEGLLRAVMEARGCDADAAREWVGGFEREDLPVQAFYGRLQQASGDRLLVDKTPSYPLDLTTLRHAEEMFEAPLYIHLTRHPRATIDSYVEAHMDRVYDFPYAAEPQAELVWLLSHQNIVQFLQEVPEERILRLRFEDLVKAPQASVEAVCAFVGLPYEPAMLEPYQGKRMTDGIHSESRMMGDPKFHRHQGIDAKVADRWQEARGALRAETLELATRLGYEIPGAASVLGPRKVARVEGVAMPLSYAQERLWFLSQLDSGSPSYNMPATIHLRGTLDVVSLARSFDEVRRRHEVLRTVFPSVNGLPIQEIQADPVRPLPIVDLAALPAGRRRPELERLALAEGRQPFDLERGPMLRTWLARLGGDEHALLVTMHHIISDGWTIGILIRELAVLYRAFVEGRPSPLPELPLQYADYAVWQRQWLDEAAVTGHLEYWKKRLAGRLPALDLPTDRPRPAVQTLHGARRSHTLSAEASQRLREWSARQGTTPFLTLLAGFNALLHRYTAQDDLLLGIPIANRNRLETEGLIGFFLNMVTQRTDASGDPTLRTLLARVSEGFLGSVPHQEVPFEKVVEAVQPERDMSRAPIFQVQFSLQNTPTEALVLPGLTLEQLEIHNRTTKFDFTVFLFDLPDGLKTTLEYNTDLFDETTIARLLGHWETVLAATPEAADLRLSDLPLLTGGEREQLLVTWNPRTAFAAEPCLHRVFEEQARRHPKNVAVVYELEELTYAKLNARANQLARRLRALGVGPEVPVGLCVERSIDTIVGLLGILKAGGAYVPLDPAYPRERLAYSLEDALSGSRAPVLVTQSHLAGLFGDELPFSVVRLDADRQSLAAESAENLDEGPDPDNVAYVIYTSGSTGRPKGVQVTHADAVRLMTATEPWFGFSPEDVWTMFHSYAFDFSVWEIWGPLLYGGRLIVVPREATLSPAAFYELLHTEGVTVLNQTPSAFRQLVQHEETERPQRLALRWVIFGGEALELSALAPWFARHGDAVPRLINMYGITETTVHVTYRPIALADLGHPGNAPIGVPIPDLTVHLLGPHGEIVPIGVPGEIHVGGAGVARGYLGRPALTAERFVPDPFAGTPGARLYRSGDLARRRPDGDLEYLGRIDHQVKIRGFRIELGEIEAALLTHPELLEAVVMARQDATGDKRLVAYFTYRGTSVPELGELRAHLRASLPEYMVPAAFVALQRMPLTPSGKIDRRALPDPEDVRAEAETTFLAPRTRTERRLADAWREVLRVEQVGVDDNFFDLGGHSLLVTQLASRIRTEFGVELPMASVFEAPTLAALAGRIEALRPADAEPELAPIPTVSRDDQPLPLSFSQERLWFLDQFQPGSPLYNVPMSLRLRGRLDVTALERTFQEVVRRHEVLRTGFTSVEGQPAQMIHPEAHLEMPVTDLSDSPTPWTETRLADLAEEEAQRPFDLSQPPLMRVRLVKIAEDDYALLATIHHIVSDGWSMGVLIREVAALYTAFAAGQPSPLPELPIQYADYAVWQRGWLQGESLDAELAFWREQLAGAPQALDLPSDHTRPPVHGFAGRHLRFTLPKSLVAQIQALARQENATLFMALLAAFQVQIHRYTRLTDFLIGSPVANRQRRELEDLIGFFVNTLVLRAHLPGDVPVPELLAQVKETTLAAFARQDLPFEKLVQSTEVARDTSRSPLFQVLFVLQNAPAQTLALPDVTLEILEPESGTSKFDLTLSMMETPEGLHGFLEYSTDLFDDATATRMLGHFRNLLEELATDHRRRISELSMLGHAERAELLTAWNDTRAEVPELPFHRLFELQVRIAPDAPAVAEAGGLVLTYAELDRQANQLARHLRSLGAGPEVRVGIAVERSPAMLAALLATLKSGAAYVPLDPSHPRERLAMILEDARPAVLVTEEKLRNDLPAPEGCRVVTLDNAWSDGGLLAGESTETLPALVESPESLAYAIFTSGSTGRPKGVQIPHGALVNFLLSMQRAPGLSAHDVLVAVTTVSFDIAGLELFLPLLVGARIELASRDEVSDGTLLAARIKASNATTLQATPAGWRMLLDAGWPGDPSFKALCGGEALTPDLAERLIPRVGSLWNVYGPTETTIWSAAGKVESVSTATAAVPIGPAIANTTLYVLDQYFEPAAVGVMGDLFIGGLGLSRGYLGSPEMTADRFIPDPFAGKAAPGARLYRTGDLARRRADGSIDFLGRADHQVKIRGYRIEPDEVAAGLAKHPGVRETVVVARPAATGDPRLVAYLIPADPAPSLDDLRAFLRDKLPAYMLPTDYVQLDTFPLNPSGKVDRRALPAPEGTAAVGRELALPETPTEETLLAVWEEVLGRTGIGVHDNFFELGGHSLLAPQIVARIEQTFQIRLPLRTFFESPTISATALNVDLLLLEEIEALSEEEVEDLGVGVS